jgi:hypothetical protein
VSYESATTRTPEDGKMALLETADMAQKVAFYAVIDQKPL